MSAYFHPSELDESREGNDGARDRPARTASVVTPWTAPQSASAHRALETESIYARTSYAGSAVRGYQPSSALQTSRRMSSAGTESAAVIPFPARTGPQVCSTADTVVRQLDRPSSGWGSFCVSPVTGNSNAPHLGVAEASALHFRNQAWEDMVATTFGSAPRAHPLLPQVRSWEPSEPTLIHPPSLINSSMCSLEPTPQNVDDDQDAHTFLCEWTDEHGTCNMDVLGDRVWMSQHLSRQHNLVGHERSQRACLWRGCSDTMNKGSLARHVVSRHLRAGATCGFCSKVYSRADVARRHTKKCKIANGGMGQREHTG